jgi:hypothetical protein
MTYNRAHRTLRGILDARVLMNLAGVVLQSRVGHGADIALVSRRVVRREDGGDRTHDGTDALVQGLVCGGFDGFFEGGAGISGEVGVGGNTGVFVEGVVVVGGCFGDWADQARSVHVEIWVGGRENGVSCANDGADLLCSGCHIAVVMLDKCQVNGVTVTGQRLREDQIRYSRLPWMKRR